MKLTHLKLKPLKFIDLKLMHLKLPPPPQKKINTPKINKKDSKEE